MPAIFAMYNERKHFSQRHSQIHLISSARQLNSNTDLILAKQGVVRMSGMWYRSLRCKKQNDITLELSAKSLQYKTRKYLGIKITKDVKREEEV